MIFVIILYALFGATFILVEQTLTVGSFIDLTWVRGAVVTIASIPHLIIFRKEIPSLFKNSLRPLIIYSSLLFTGYISFHWAAQNILPVKAAVYYTLAPFITALIGHFFFKEKITKNKLIGIIISAIGIAIIIYDKNDFSINTSSTYVSDLILLFAVTSYSLSWLIIKKTIKKEKAPAPVINGISSLFVLLLTTPLMLMQAKTVIDLPIAFWKWSMLESLVGGVAGYTLYIYLLNFYSATFISLASLLEPCFTAFYQFVLLNKIPSMLTILSTFVIALGLIVFYIDDLKYN